MDLKGKRVAVLTEEKYEDLEPVSRAALARSRRRRLAGRLQIDHVHPASTAIRQVDRAIGEVKSEDFDGCVVPGLSLTSAPRSRLPPVRPRRWTKASLSRPLPRPYALFGCSAADGRRVFPIREDMENAGARLGR
jgi:hypothetical protein